MFRCKFTRPLDVTASCWLFVISKYFIERARTQELCFNNEYSYQNSSYFISIIYNNTIQLSTGPPYRYQLSDNKFPAARSSSCKDFEPIILYDNMQLVCNRKTKEEQWMRQSIVCGYFGELCLSFYLKSEANKTAPEENYHRIEIARRVLIF